MILSMPMCAVADYNNNNSKGNQKIGVTVCVYSYCNN